MDEQQREQEGGGRISLNLRIDGAKFAIMERMRTTGFGLAQTERNRSDVYNEILGYGLQTNDLKQRLGERDFAKLWFIINNMDVRKLNLNAIEKMMAK